jgi:glycosyltransferase involved in cell wall biosynthesis
MIPVTLVLPVLQPAGAERIVADLAQRLPAHGFAASVLCLEDDRAPIGDELRVAKIPVSGLQLSRRRTLACAQALAAKLGAERPMILHAHLFHANIAARAALMRMSAEQRRGLHVLSTVHVAERRFRPWQFALDRITARYARAEVCVSRAVAAFQKEHTGLPETFFRVIENGIDLSRFGPAPAGKTPSLNVLSVGRLDPQKDFATLLRAWKFVENELPSAQLCIAGEGPERTKLEELIRSLGLQNVRLPGFVQNIPELLRGSDVYVQTSAWEGFGLAVAEAMACALPVVVSDADSLPELVTHNKTGLVAPTGRPEDFARAILELLKNREKAAALAQAARAEALARFSVERMVRDYAAFYRELLCEQ